MDVLDPRSIRKGSKIRLDDTTEGSDGFLGGTVGNVDPYGRVTIDHVGTFHVEGLTTTKPRPGYIVFRLAEHTPPSELVDERIDAWERVARHPVFSSAYDGEGPLIDSVMAVLDGIVHQAAPAPEPEPELPTTPGSLIKSEAGDLVFLTKAVWIDQDHDERNPSDWAAPWTQMVVIDLAKVDVDELLDVQDTAEMGYPAETTMGRRAGVVAILAHLGIEAS